MKSIHFFIMSSSSSSNEIDPNMFECIYKHFVTYWIPLHPEHLEVLTMVSNIWTSENAGFAKVFAQYIAEEHSEVNSFAYLPSQSLYDEMVSFFFDCNSDGSYDWLLAYNTKFVQVNQKLYLAHKMAASPTIHEILDIAPTSSAVVISKEVLDIFQSLTQVIRKEVEGDRKEVENDRKRKMEEDVERRVAAKVETLTADFDRRCASKLAEQKKRETKAKQALQSEVVQLKADLETVSSKADRLQKYYDRMTEMHANFKFVS